jgi:preprotein translocase subunit YajC
MIIGVFLLIMAPQMKRNKEHKKLISSLQPGDEVLTTGGVFGVVTGVKPDRFVIEIAKGVRIEVNRANVEVRVPTPAQTGDDKEKKA